MLGHIFLKYENKFDFACFSASSDVIHSSRCLCEIVFLYNVLITDFIEIYALYGKFPNVIIERIIAPL